MALIKCKECGNEVSTTAKACPKCGALQSAGTSKRILPAMLLCFFFGWAGIHRFLHGKVGTGILMLFTGGGFLIWWLIDFIMIIVGSFKDKAGNAITQWT